MSPGTTRGHSLCLLLTKIPRPREEAVVAIARRAAKLLAQWFDPSDVRSQQTGGGDDDRSYSSCRIGSEETGFEVTTHTEVDFLYSRAETSTTRVRAYGLPKGTALEIVLSDGDYVHRPAELSIRFESDDAAARAMPRLLLSATELTPAPSATIALARDLIRQGDHELAVELLSSLSKQAQSPDAAYRIGRLYSLVGGVSEAVAWLRRANELDPSQPHHGAAYWLGRVLEEQGQLPAALDAYRAAMTIPPSPGSSFDDEGFDFQWEASECVRRLRMLVPS